MKTNHVLGCPHPHIPSDHFPLLVEFGLTLPGKNRVCCCCCCFSPCPAHPGSSSFLADRPRNLAVSTGLLQRFFTFNDVGFCVQLNRCSVVCNSGHFGQVSDTILLGSLFILARNVFRYTLYPERNSVCSDSPRCVQKMVSIFGPMPRHI